MQSGGRRAAARRHAIRPYLARAAALIALGLGVAGCATSGPTPLAQAPAGSTVAFESIDGPPAHVFRKLVQKLNAEAEARNVPVVSRETRAPYRVRGYLALGIEKKQKRTIVSWVWDVYDANERRALRIEGEEQGGPVGRDPWAAANDEILGRIAKTGMERLAIFFQQGGKPAQPEIAPAAPPADGEERHPNVARVDDGRPQASGVPGARQVALGPVQ
ncbi:MAG: hypothetical protein HXY30_11710 [Pseudorhodoplanes sp.]|nr:hypothetical protein [Pseudorhodoplanes sp.]